MKEKKDKIIYYLSMHVLIALFILILSGFYVLFYPFNPVTFHSDRFPTDKTVYRQGEKIQYTLNFTKHMNIKPEISYYLVDGIVYPLSKEGVSRPVGTQVRVLSMVVPDEIQPGKYRIQIDFVYRIYFREIYRTWQSTEFEIISK